MMDEAPVTIATFGSGLDGQEGLDLACEHLRLKRVEFIVHSNVQRTRGTAAQTQRRLQVSPSDVARARTALANAERELAERARNAPAPEIDPEEGPVCPKCHKQYATLRRTTLSAIASLFTFGLVAPRRRWSCAACRHEWQPPPEPPSGAGPYRGR